MKDPILREGYLAGVRAERDEIERFIEQEIVGAKTHLERCDHGAYATTCAVSCPRARVILALKAQIDEARAEIDRLKQQWAKATELFNIAPSPTNFIPTFLPISKELDEALARAEKAEKELNDYKTLHERSVALVFPGERDTPGAYLKMLRDAEAERDNALAQLKIYKIIHDRLKTNCNEWEKVARVLSADNIKMRQGFAEILSWTDVIFTPERIRELARYALKNLEKTMDDDK